MTPTPQPQKTGFPVEEPMLDDRHRAATQSTWISVAVNAVLSTAQVIIGLFAQSQSLISDGFHSLSDLIADFVVLAANKVSRQRADSMHPYGHARFETVASLVLGLILMVAAAGMLLVAGRKFLAPDEIPRVHVIALYAALFTLVAKEGLFRYMLSVARRVGSSMLAANAWHARADAASSLVVALGIAGNLMGWPFLDPLAAAAVGLMIARTGGAFVFKALQRLADSGLSLEETAKIRSLLLETPGVKDVHDLRTRYMGDDVLIDVHLMVDGRASASEAHLIGIAASERLKHAGDAIHHQILDVLVHIDTEDDSGEEAHTYPTLPTRDQLVTALTDALARISANTNPPMPEMMLHYLNDRVEMDWIFPSPLTQEEKAWIFAAAADLSARFSCIAHIRVLTVIDEVGRTTLVADSP
ncbi:MAG: cation diffusion facilitator family transporter [Burkholderiales bacterium]|jgi:cation diffusion facilitator family transporter|nr:cation diffusion facilitator family transporter [Burkholderiales bacterium]